MNDATFYDIDPELDEILEDMNKPLSQVFEELKDMKIDDDDKIRLNEFLFHETTLR